MKKYLAVITVALAALLLLSSCGRGNKFVADGVTFVDKKTNITYNFAPFCYEPIIMGEEVYGSDGDLYFYEIMGQDPKQWLGETDGGVFYAEGVTLPTLDQMLVARLEVCSNDEHLLIRDRTTKSEEIAEVVDAYMNGTSYLYPNVTPSASYKLRFADTSRGIYYCLDFMRYEDGYRVYVDGYEENLGTDFIYNRSEDRFVKAPAILSDLVDGRSNVQ